MQLPGTCHTVRKAYTKHVRQLDIDIAHKLPIDRNTSDKTQTNPHFFLLLLPPQWLIL